MTDWLAISGKTVIVTGGSSGIGKSIVHGLLEQNVHVVNFDIQEDEFKHPNLLFIKTDITSREEVESSVAEAVEKFGTVDGLVNNAGINIPRLLVDGKAPYGEYELADSDFDKMVAINQKGVYLMAQTVGRILVEKREGVIINMSSESGLEGSEGQSCYAATKAALNSYTRSLGRRN